jgi:hypothetical protein
MRFGKAAGPTRCGGGVGAREFDRLGRLIDLKTNQSSRKKQPAPLRRRAAYLARQQRVRARAEAKEAKEALATSSAPLHTLPGNFPRSQGIGSRQGQFAPEQRERLERFGAEVDRVTQADRRFFERFPWRSHRVRLASRAECEQLEVLCGHRVLSPDSRWYIAIRNVAPGLRIRIYIVGLADNETDLSEMEAALIYEAHVGERGRQIEAIMRGSGRG